MSTTLYVHNSLIKILTAITFGSNLWKVAMSMLMFWVDSATTSDRGAPPIRIERKTGNLWGVFMTDKETAGKTGNIY